MARLGDPVAAAPGRDRRLAGLVLVAITLVSWAYLLSGAGMDMAPSGMEPGIAMPMGWTAREAALMFTMWWVMMLAMMLPSAAPMILLFATVAGRAGRRVPTVLFVSGYLGVWGGFSLIATAVQWHLTGIGALDGMRLDAPLLAGGLLLVAGLYQLSPAKAACLRHCRSPLEFVTRHWRPGLSGALQMGLRHGAYCLGCCWALMALLFVGGVMTLTWIGALAAYVLIEKIAPPWRYFTQVSAILLVLAGTILIGHSIA